MSSYNLLREFAESPIEHEDPRMDYITIQVDRETWHAARQWVDNPPWRDAPMERPTSTPKIVIIVFAFAIAGGVIAGWLIGS